MTTSQLRQRGDLRWLAIAGGAFGLAIVLSLTHVATRLVDTAISLDLHTIAFLNQFAHRSRVIDSLIWQIWTTAALQGGAVMALVWGVWFSRSEDCGSQPKRETLLSSLVGMYVCLLVTLVLRAALPFRLRPASDVTVFHQMPYLPNGMIHVPEATSFPSGHAAVLFSLAIGLALVSRRLGLLAALHGLFVVCLPRLYFGRHFATDILAGAVLAVVTVLSVNTMLYGSAMVRRLLTWADTYPAVFYGVMFLCSLDIATDFTYAKTIIHFASLMAKMSVARIVMLPLGLTPS
jgi:undecaprenyl-diphosphatase